MCIAIDSHSVLPTIRALATCTSLVHLSIEISGRSDSDEDTDSDDEEERLTGVYGIPAVMAKLSCQLGVLGVGASKLDESAFPVLRRLVHLPALMELKEWHVWFTSKKFVRSLAAEEFWDQCWERGIRVRYSLDGSESFFVCVREWSWSRFDACSNPKAPIFPN